MVQRFLWQGTSIEDYKAGSLVGYGQDKAHFDFMFVMKGQITCKLDRLQMDSTHGSRNSSTFVTFGQGEYIDIKTITSKRLKKLSAEVWKDGELNPNLDMPPLAENSRNTAMNSVALSN